MSIVILEQICIYKKLKLIELFLVNYTQNSQKLRLKNTQQMLICLASNF